MLQEERFEMNKKLHDKLFKITIALFFYILVLFFVILLATNVRSDYLTDLQLCENKLADTKTRFEDYNYLIEEYKYYQGDNLNIAKPTNKKVINISKSLKKETVEDTIFTTIDFVDYFIEYKVFYYYRPIEKVLMDHLGDCTEYAELTMMLLAANGIYSKRVHGFEGDTKHDWIEVLYPSPQGWLYWQPINRGDRKTGNSYW